MFRYRNSALGRPVGTIFARMHQTPNTTQQGKARRRVAHPPAKLKQSAVLWWRPKIIQTAIHQWASTFLVLTGRGCKHNILLTSLNLGYLPSVGLGSWSLGLKRTRQEKVEPSDEFLGSTSTFGGTPLSSSLQLHFLPQKKCQLQSLWEASSEGSAPVPVFFGP